MILLANRKWYQMSTSVAGWHQILPAFVLQKKWSALFSYQESFRILNFWLPRKPTLKQFCLLTLWHVHWQINNRWSGKHLTVERMSQNSANPVIKCYSKITLICTNFSSWTGLFNYWETPFFGTNFDWSSNFQFGKCSEWDWLYKTRDRCICSDHLSPKTRNKHFC